MVSYVSAVASNYPNLPSQVSSEAIDQISEAADVGSALCSCSGILRLSLLDQVRDILFLF